MLLLLELLVLRMDSVHTCRCSQANPRSKHTRRRQGGGEVLRQAMHHQPLATNRPFCFKLHRPLPVAIMPRPCMCVCSWVVASAERECVLEGRGVVNLSRNTRRRSAHEESDDDDDDVACSGLDKREGSRSRG